MQQKKRTLEQAFGKDLDLGAPSKRLRQNGHDPRLDLLESIFGVPPEPKEKIKAKVKLSRPRLSKDELERIIALRHGPEGRVQRREMSVKRIASRLKLCYTTVIAVLQRYRRRGGTLEPPVKRKPPPYYLKVTPEIKERLISKDTLKRWAPLSLEARCQCAYNELGVNISRFTLANVYRKAGIKKTRLKWQFTTRFNENELTKARKEFVNELLNYLASGVEVIYIDETAVNLWDMPRKIWQPSKERLTVALPKTRGSSVNIVGALSSATGKLIWQVSDEFKKEQFITFVNQLAVGNHLNCQNEVVLVMDNLRIHHTKDVQDLLEGYGYRALFLPPSSSHLNPIETTWAWFKNHWRREQFINAQQNKDLTRQQVYQQIDDILSAITPRLGLSFASSAAKDMRMTILADEQ